MPRGKKISPKSRTVLQYCFAREKKIVFAQQKQSVPMSINEFVEMTIVLCLICFAIYDKMQGFVDESVLKTFIEIALSHSVSKIYGFLRFTQKFKIATKSGGKIFFGEPSPVECADTLWVKNFVEIALSRSVSKINTFLHCLQKFKMAAKSGGKTIFAKSCQCTLQVPCWSKISSNSLYLAPFLR